jgi:hypothetical protein
MSKLDHSGNPIYRADGRWWKGLIILNPIFLKYWANNKVCILLLFEVDFTIDMNPVSLCWRYKKSDFGNRFFTLNKFFVNIFQLDYIILKNRNSRSILSERFSLKYKLVRYYNV